MLLFLIDSIGSTVENKINALSTRNDLAILAQGIGYSISEGRRRLCGRETQRTPEERARVWMEAYPVLRVPSWF